MAKIALLLLAGCILFGLFKLVTPENNKSNAAEQAEPSEDHELDDRDDPHMPPEKEDTNNRIGVSAIASAISPARIISSSLSPILSTVECYVCTDCPKVTSKTPSKICPYTFDTRKRNRCVVYAEHYKHMKKPWYIRGCAAERGSCSDIRKAHSAHADIVSLLFCAECEGDKCNTNGANSLSDFTMAFLLMVVTPVIAKYTLS